MMSLDSIDRMIYDLLIDPAESTNECVLALLLTIVPLLVDILHELTYNNILVIYRYYREMYYH